MTKIRMKVQGSDDPAAQIVVLEESNVPYLSLKQTAIQLGIETTIHCCDNGIYSVELKGQNNPVQWRNLDEPVRLKVQNNLNHHLKPLGSLNEQIFSKPELGNEEYFAVEKIIGFLHTLGVTVEKDLTGIHPQTGETLALETAFKASVESARQGPVITIMVEYDALPMGHACGHNLITVSGLAAFCALLPMIEEWGGKLHVIGTPAEEGGHKGGKIPLLAAGHFGDSDIVLITHPGDRWDTGADFLAISGGRFTFTGVPSHASAAPDQGISALDAAIMAYTGIENLREHIRSDARIHGIIKEGGEAPNIVPDRASLSYAVRALDQPYVEELKEKIEICVRAGAAMAGAKADIHWSFGYSAPINVPLLDDLVRDIAGAEQISGIHKWEALGSSDLGNVGYEIPTCNLWFQIAPEGILPHTHEFLDAAGSESGFEAAIQAGRVLALSAAILFQNPDLVEKIKRDFRQRKNELLQKTD
jgi:amidohydrolase